MRKLLVSAIFIACSIFAFSTPGTPGYTGLIDYPTAYNLRLGNYTFSGILDNVNEDTNFGVMLEGGFVSQVEMGLKLSTSEKLVNDKLMKSNFKFQFVQEGERNPALAFGFVEEDSVFGYLVMSRRINKFINDKIKLDFSLGITYDEDNDTDVFAGFGIPLFPKVKLLSEIYTYDKVKVVDGNEKEDNKVGVNLGGEFFTTDKIYTKAFWRISEETFGFSVSYIGLYGK